MTAKPSSERVEIIHPLVPAEPRGTEARLESRCYFRGSREGTGQARQGSVFQAIQAEISTFRHFCI